jgi:hypothetical protein
MIENAERHYYLSPLIGELQSVSSQGVEGEVSCITSNLGLAITKGALFLILFLIASNF